MSSQQPCGTQDGYTREARGVLQKPGFHPRPVVGAAAGGMSVTLVEHTALRDLISVLCETN